MQKKLLSTTALLVAAGIAAPTFAQWTISAGVQSTQLEVESRAINDTPADYDDFSRNDQATGIGGELAVGYQYNFDATYNVALEAFGQLSDAQVRAESSESFDLDPAATVTWIAGLRVRPGYFVTPSTRLFLDGGVVVGGFEVEQNDVAVQQASAASNGETFNEEDVSTVWGWRYGVGVEHKIMDHFMVGVDYTVTEFDDVNSEFAQDYSGAQNALGNAGTESVNYKPTLHTIGLNFKYLFGAKKHAKRHYEMRDK